MYNSSMARPPRLQASLSAGIEECRIAPSTNQLRGFFVFSVSMIGLLAFGDDSWYLNLVVDEMANNACGPSRS